MSDQKEKEKVTEEEESHDWNVAIEDKEIPEIKPPNDKIIYHNLIKKD